MKKAIPIKVLVFFHEPCNIQLRLTFKFSLLWDYLEKNQSLPLKTNYKTHFHGRPVSNNSPLKIRFWRRISEKN